MAKVVVLKVIKQDKTKKGTQYWNCMGTIDGEPDVFDMWNEPEIGKEYEGEIRESDFGKSFSLPRQGGGGRGRYERSPEETASIIRQNSNGHATLVMTTVARMIFDAADDKQKGLEDAKAMLRPDKVFALADLYFHKSAGSLNLGSSIAPASSPSQVAVSAETKEAVTAAFPEAADQVEEKVEVDPTKHTNDINPNEIPF